MESTQPRPVCKICKCRAADRLPRRKDGSIHYRDTCTMCRKKDGLAKDTERMARNREAVRNAKPHIRPLCTVCGKYMCRKQGERFGLKADGTPYYHTSCSSCAKAKRAENKPDEHFKGYRRKAFHAAGANPACAHCGFVPIHLCQLDVDHKDGDRKNDDICNLQILCANCHRLKTRVHEDDQRWMEARRKLLTSQSG